MSLRPRTLLDRRIPQPTEYDRYGVPSVLRKGLNALYAERNSCASEEVATIDAAILRLLEPWTR